MADLVQLLTDRLAPAFEEVAGSAVDPVVRRSDHADFQANGVLALAKSLGRSPRDIATEIVAAAGDRLSEVCSSIEISGPGFINLVLSNDVLAVELGKMNRDERLGVPLAAEPETVIVDYSAPNVAKEMHVGHLRSTVIGDAVVRLMDWLGHEVIKANHLGDWGTPFGMLIEHLIDVGETEAATELSVGDLNGFYQAARRKFDADEEFAERARSRVVALQGGDEESLRLWQLLREESEKYFLTVYDQLDVRLTQDDFFGESFYNDMLDSVVAELDELGLLVTDDGAKVVFPEGFTNRDGDPLPLIVVKSDGGYGYAATDLAAIRYRLRDLGATRLLYVVGVTQRQHLEMIYEVARAAGWLKPPATAEHIGFGSVLGTDGKMLRTRAGANIKLLDLIGEAVTRAATLIEEKNPDLDADERATVARQVGLGALKYADLSNQRTKDYTFDWDRMLSFNGDTAPYLQYARARILSIFRRGDVEPDRTLERVQVTEPAERELALVLLAFEPVVREVAETLEFHRLTTYLYELASAFSRFYEECPVLVDDAEKRRVQVTRSGLVSRTLSAGLFYVGVEPPDAM